MAYTNMLDWFKVNPPGVKDDSAAIQNAFDQSIGKTVIMPDGIFNIGSMLNLPVGVKLEMSPNTILKAINPMTAVISSPVNTAHEFGLISGGQIDCNDLADNGIEIRFAKNFLIKNITIHKAKKVYLKLGDSLSPNNSYEFMLQNVNINRPYNSLAPAGSIGVQTVNCHDSHFHNMIIVGAETGMEINGSDNHLMQIHCWNRPSNGQMKYAFIVNGRKNFLTSCVADTSTIYGFWVKSYNNHFANCHVYNGQWGPIDETHPDGKWDNTLIGVYIDALGDYNTFVGMNFAGNVDTRILKDFDGALTNNVILGLAHVNVTNRTTQQIMSVITNDLTVNGDFNYDGILTAGDYINLNGAEGEVQRAFHISTNGTQKWRIGSDGGIGVMDAGLSLMAYQDGGGQLEALWIDRRNANIIADKGNFKISGTWNKPLKFGLYCLWISADGKLRLKNGDPANDNDGTIVGTQS